MAKSRYKDGVSKVISGRMKVMESGDRKLYRIRIEALNSKVNRNNWQFINLEQHLKEFRDIPILVAYPKEGVVGDGHNFDMRIDPKTGKEYASFTAPDAERIVGWIPKDANIRIERIDDTDWVVADGWLWKFYAKELTDMIARQGSNGMDVSIETLITREHREGNVDVEEEYIVLGVTILGNGVQPAVVDARIHSLSALTELRNSMKTEIMKAASYATEETKSTKNNGGNRPMNRRNLDNLGTKFEGFITLAASEDGTRVALLSADGVPHSYEFADTDNGNVIVDRIRECSASAVFRFGENDAVEADLFEVIGKANASKTAAETRCAELEEENKNLAALVADMKAKELSRRGAAALAAMTDELNKRNANREGSKKFSETICTALKERIANNEFNSMEDANGNWIGEQAVRSAVSALCMDEQTRMDAEEMKNSQSIHVWNRSKDGAPVNDGTIASLLARKGIK